MTIRRLLSQLLVVSLFVFSEINAQFQCSGRWAYICEGRRRALSNDAPVQDVRVSEDPVDNEKLVAEAVRGDENQNEDADTPEWFLNLLEESLRRTNGDDVDGVENKSQRSKSVDSPESLSHRIVPPRRLTNERDSAATGIDEDDGAAMRRHQLQALARRLVSNDGLRRSDDDGQLEIKDRKFDSGYVQVYRKSAPSNERKFVEDFATKKRLLAKWLQEDRS